MVGNAGVAHGAEVDRVEPAQLVQAVFGHHAARFSVGFAAPVEVRPGKLDAELSARSFEHPQALGNHFAANAVALNYRNSVSLQGSLPVISIGLFDRWQGEVLAQRTRIQFPLPSRHHQRRHAVAYRSEERRVGKEGRSRWAPYD